jgi:hypothetical protein
MNLTQTLPVLCLASATRPCDLCIIQATHCSPSIATTCPTSRAHPCHHTPPRIAICRVFRFRARRSPHTPPHPPILPFTSTTSTFDPSVGAKLALLDIISFPLFSGLPRYYLHVSPLLKPRTCSSPYHVFRMREGDCYIVMSCRL